LFPVLNLSVSPAQYVCPGQGATINASVTGGNGGPYSYLWSNGSTSASQTVNPLVSTTYYVTATDNCSPPVTDSVLVNVFDLPAITFTADTFSGCKPLTVTFFNTTANTTNPVWNFGDGFTATGDTVIHSYMDNGVYDVQLTVTGNGGCVDSLQQSNFITVYNTPIADFYYAPDSIDMLNTNVEFFDNSYGNNINYWAWNFNYQDTSYQQNPVYTFPEDTGLYYVSLYIKDVNGCKDSTFKFVRIKGVYTIYVPNAFTPLDTKHLNDFFKPYGIGISDKDFNFYIYDRWGNLIYESHDLYDKGWDGTYNGVIVPLDVYVWKLQFKDINGKHHVLHGHVTIVK
jgi:gliding motility-associated-like protein